MLFQKSIFCFSIYKTKNLIKNFFNEENLDLLIEETVDPEKI